MDACLLEMRPTANLCTAIYRAAELPLEQASLTLFICGAVLRFPNVDTKLDRTHSEGATLEVVRDTATEVNFRRESSLTAPMST